METGKRNTVKCKLDDGTIMEYDACSKEKDYYDSKVFSYIGKGTIYSVLMDSGTEVMQSEKGTYHFYRYA